MDLQLTDKKVLVTGSTAGIGYAIAKGLAAAGSEVVLQVVRDNETMTVRILSTDRRRLLKSPQLHLVNFRSHGRSICCVLPGGAGCFGLPQRLGLLDGQLRRLPKPCCLGLRRLCGLLRLGPGLIELRP